MKTSPNRLWITVLVLGWLFDFLFWKRAGGPGINFALFTVLCLLGGLLILLADGKRPNLRTTLLVPFLLSFAIITFTRAEPLTQVLALFATLFIISLMAITYLDGKWLRYDLMDYTKGYFHLIVSILTRPLSFSMDVRREKGVAKKNSRRIRYWAVIRGIVIALPILAVFAALLASADIVFDQKLRMVIEFFRLENLPEYIFRGAYILMIGYALAGVILHAASESRDEHPERREGVDTANLLGFTESGIVMGSVIVLFSAFVVIQFQYFFGGQANIHIDGYTYSEYARRGFGELVVVAAFSLLMLQGLSAITRREGEAQRKIFSGMGVILVLHLMVIMVSAYQRLALYESAYGFSRLRTYTHVFLLWIGLLLIVTIVLEILHRERLFITALVFACMGFGLSLAVLNVDAFIVQRNVNRELSSDLERAADELDSAYFLQLSDDAIPSLVEAYQNPNIPKPLHDELGARLACIRHLRSQEARAESWQSFHWSRYRAAQALMSIRTDLDGYQINDTDLPMSVTTPSGEELECWEYSYD